MEIINIGPAYIWEWAEGCGGWVGDGKGKIAQRVNFKVAMTCTSTYPQRANIPLQGLDKCGPTVGAISGPHWQISAIH